MESRLEATKRKIRQLERKLAKEATHVLTFDDDMFAAMIDLCSNVRALWDAPTTTNQDRKQILRLLIKNVIQEHRDAERILLRIVWTDSTTDTTVEVKLGGYVNRVMAEMLTRTIHECSKAKASNVRQIGARAGMSDTGIVDTMSRSEE